MTEQTTNRIDKLFERLSQEGGKAFVAYLAAGDPTLDKTVDLVLALEEAGADIIELGVPFSDPLADGVVNQLAAQRALDAGATLQGVFECVAKIRKKSQIPIVLFTYYNPVFKYGVPEFIQKCEEVGVDGILNLDLPPEEAHAEWPEGAALKRISLIAPTTPKERISEITAQSSGFIYYVSRAGVTGMQDSVATGLKENVEAIKATTNIPVCVGFGISKPKQASLVAEVADGVVVGSGIVNQIAEHGQSPELLEKLKVYVSPLTSATHSADGGNV